MASTIFSSAQRIIAQILQWTQSSGQSKTNNLILDSFQSGIDNATGIGEGFMIVPGSNNTPSTPTISVTTGGIAYDVNGNRVFIDPSDTKLYDATAPLTQTNDGLGNLLFTPQSTGVINIPLTQTSQNYVWVDYLASIDPTAFTLNKVTQAKIFYKQTDGYAISVTTVNTPPDSGSIFLGSVDMTGGGSVQPSNISQVGRTYYQILPNVVPIITAKLNRSDATTTYNPSPNVGPANRYTLETHIKAVGTGVVGPVNPHGTSLADLGVSQFDTVVGHRQLEHGNGIIAGIPGTPYPSTSAMATSIFVQNPGSDYISVDELLTSEFAIVNGVAYTVFDIFGAVPSNARINFPTTPGSSGVYNVFWDSVGKAFGVTTGDISNDNTKLWIATVTWTLLGAFTVTFVTSSVVLQVSSTSGMNIGDTIVQGSATTTITNVDSGTQIHVVSTTGFTTGNALDTSLHNSLTTLIDRRRIGSTTHLMQRWITNARPGVGSLQPESGEFGFNLTNNTLEWWDGSAWQQPVTFSSNVTVPTGAVLPFAGVSAPSGFLLATGGVVSQTTYSNLFAVIGTIYNTGGEGAGNFRLPNMTNNVPVGAGSIAALGATAGAQTQTPTEAAHTHTGSSHQHSENIVSSGGSIAVNNGSEFGSLPESGSRLVDTFVGTGSFVPTAIHLTSLPQGDTGTGSTTATINPVSVIQPVLGLNYVIKY